MDILLLSPLILKVVLKFQQSFKGICQVNFFLWFAFLRINLTYFTIGTYELAQFHLHWGDENGGKGSEHTLFGKQYDAELHFVHYNTKCGNNLGQAIANCAGHEALAVLGVFIDVGGDDNHAYDEIIDGLKDIQTEGTSAEIKTFDMTKLMPHDLDEFFRYNGGLTTPSCNEIVTWTVFKVGQYIFEIQNVAAT